MIFSGERPHFAEIYLDPQNGVDPPSGITAATSLNGLMWYDATNNVIKVVLNGAVKTITTS
jgi:hypothetical protein